MTQWERKAEPVFDTSISPDRLSWRVQITLTTWPPPLEHWALMAGDAVHNMRSALDALVWENTNTESLSPGQRQKVAFPIADTVEKWEQAKNRLRGVNSDVLKRIGEVQPFQQSEAHRASNALTALHSLDIDDKHRAGLSAAPLLATTAFESAMEFESEDAAERNAPPNSNVDMSRAESDGVLVVSGTTRDRLVKIEGGVHIGVQVNLETPLGQVLLLPLLSQFLGAIAIVLNHVGGTKIGPLTVAELSERLQRELIDPAAGNASTNAL